MNKDDVNIDRLFRERFSTFREVPGKDAWAGIDYDLNRHKKIKYLWYFRIAAASVLLMLAFSCGYFYALYNKTSKISKSERSLENNNISASKPVLINSAKHEHVVSKSRFQNIYYPTPNIAAQESHKQFNNQETIYLGKKISKKSISSFFTTFSFAKIENEIKKNSDQFVPLPFKNIDLLKNTNSISENIPTLSSVNSQDVLIDTKQSPLSKFKLGATFSPLFSFRNYNGNGQSLTEAEIYQHEKTLSSYSGGADIRYQIAKSIEITSGVYYSRIGLYSTEALVYKSNSNSLFLYAVNTSAGNINIKDDMVPAEVLFIPADKDTVSIDEIMNSKVTLNFNFLEIPLLARFRIVERKLVVNAGAGLSGSVLLSKSVLLDYKGQTLKIGEPDDIRNYLYQTVFFIGVEYPLSKHFSFDINPTLRYSINKINKQTTFDYRPYSYSIKTGLIYNF